MIEVKHLCKRYGEHVAVDDLSFTIENGHVYGFLGPNGAGKSTTMNILTGCLAATSGTVSIDGFDIYEDAAEAKSRIGYLPEIPPLYTDMTVWEYLMFVAKLKKVSKKDCYEHVDAVIEKIQLDEVADRMIRNLSKGYKQRVGLAQALIGDPEVLILDEPMVGMDPRQIIEMRDLLKGLAPEHTIILSSHILSEISAVCDHIMIISHGQLAASGSPEELQERMQTQAELELTVCAGQEEVEAVLSAMDDIESYTFEEADTPENIRVLITERSQTDIRKSLSVKLAGAGIPILSMNRKERSLEDIFLELTESEEETATQSENSQESAKEDSGDAAWTEKLEENTAETFAAENSEISEMQTDDQSGDREEDTEHDSDI